MFMKKILIVASATLFSLPAFASVGEVEDDYAMEHEMLDNDLRAKTGMAVSHDARDPRHMELVDANGDRHSYRLDPSGTGNCVSGGTVCYRETGDSLDSAVVTYSTGRNETAYPESHDQNELNEHVARLGFTVESKTKGVMTVRDNANGGRVKVECSAKTVRGASGYAPGLRIEHGRIIERHADGMEQELRLVP